MNAKPLLTILVALRNEAQYIAEMLDSLLSQESNFELEYLFADGHSSDNSCQIIAEKMKNESFNIITNTKIIQSSGYNMASRIAHGQIMIRCDAHCIYPPGFFREIYQRIVIEKYDFITFTMNSKGRTKKGKCIAYAFSSVLGVGLNGHRINYQYLKDQPGFLLAIKRELFVQEKGFNETYPVAEDYELVRRLLKKDYKHMRSPIAIDYYVRESYRKLGKQLLRYGYYKWQYFLNEGKCPRIRNLIPAIFLIYLIIGCVAFGCTAHPLWLAPLIVYFSAIALFIYKATKTLGTLPSLRLIMVYPTMHIFYGLGNFLMLINTLYKNCIYIPRSQNK